jgi:hypothetical protein
LRPSVRVGATTSIDIDASIGGERGGDIAWPRRLTPLLEAVVVLSIWLLNRFYRGIVHDSRIYIGRALADLDPEGLGREPTFLYDHQTQNSIFSHLITPLVRALGPSATSMGVALAALLIWLAAAAWLANRLMPRRLVPAALICAAVLPAFYGPFDIFSFGEALATPRGFAEAGVLAGLAALLGGRRILCGGLLLVAALFHPVMAAPGFGIAFLILAKEDRRWWGLAPVGLIGLGIATALHVGPTKALFSVYDPAWLEVMHRRNGFLFLKDWPQTAWYGAALPATTLIMAALLVQGRARVVIAAALIGAAACLAGSFIFGDLLGSQLMIELQLWRALWIVQVLAVLLTPVVAVGLWATERRDAQVSVVLLVVSWLELNGMIWDLPVLAAALGFATIATRAGVDRVSPAALIAVSAGAIAIVLAAIGVGAYATLTMVQIFARIHAAPPFYFLLALKLHLPRTAVIAVVLTTLVFPTWIRPPLAVIGLALCGLILAPLAVIAWDQRTPTRRMIDLGQGRAELNRLIGPATGTGVVWLPDDTAPWLLLSRASWAADLQGSVGAFSRPLAIGWNARAAELVSSGLGVVRDPHAWDQAPVPRTLTRTQTRDGALRLCAAPNGPQAIVLSGDLTQAFAPGVAARWRAPVTNVMLAPGSLNLRLAPFDVYTVVRCDRT